MIRRSIAGGTATPKTAVYTSCSTTWTSIATLELCSTALAQLVAK